MQLTELMQVMRLWQQHGWIRALDCQFAQFIASNAPHDQPWVALLACLASHQLGRGHPCLDLSLLVSDSDDYLQLPPEFASAESLQLCPRPRQLLASITVGELQQALSAAEATRASSNTPLAWVAGERLYLRRFWRYEQFIKADLARRMQRQPSRDSDKVRRVLQQLFGDGFSWQKLACAIALRSGFSIITGGPGTGKTYTVVRLLATLYQLHQGGQTLQVKLAAPTGKAAARMTESISKELASMVKFDSRLADLDVTAVTLHRLLGSQPNSRFFKRNAGNPLSADVVIIDEASMIDIDMMASLLAALPAYTTVILLGDKDQLASVGAGAILGQLCRDAELGNYQAELLRWLEQVTGQALPGYLLADPQRLLPSAHYHQHTVMLRESRRFDAEQGIGKLAAEINLQRSEWLSEWLRQQQSGQPAEPQFANISYLSPAKWQTPAVRKLIQQGMAEYLRLLAEPVGAESSAHDQWARALLNQFSQFQVLTAVNHGEWGMHSLNQAIKAWLHPNQQDSNWYHGRPIMVTRNDYNIDLRNGDIGIALQVNQQAPLRLAFFDQQQGIRWLLPSRLSHYETVYAMTVHKSQGSEFNHTVVVLPEHDVPVLSKELLYTAVTRAREQLSLICTKPEVILRTVQKRVDRIGGLIAAGQEQTEDHP